MCKETTLMNDCVHLHACRRLQNMWKKRYKVSWGRGCNEDCTAYETAAEIEVYDIDEAASHIWSLLEEYADHDPRDIFARWDIPIHTVKVLSDSEE